VEEAPWSQQQNNEEETQWSHNGFVNRHSGLDFLAPPGFRHIQAAPNSAGI
jgi:hypothetical protein